MTLWEFVLIAAIVMAELLPACFPFLSISGEKGVALMEELDPRGANY